jgi:hypothetical protein
VNELQDYLTPEFLEKLALTDESKADIILAGKIMLILNLHINKSSSVDFVIRNIQCCRYNY